MATPMKRTTIMLPEDLHRRAQVRARQKGVSLGEVIRDSLSAALPSATYGSGTDPLYEDVVFDGPAPSDVAAHHDRYLYDEEK